MYKQFCKNLKHFIGIMSNDGEKNFRKQQAEALLLLADVDLYIEYKKSGSEEYRKISKLIYDISRYSEDYPALKKLVWELWAYGFDIEEQEGIQTTEYEAQEVAKLADLLISTHYFA